MRYYYILQTREAMIFETACGMENGANSKNEYQFKAIYGGTSNKTDVLLPMCRVDTDAPKTLSNRVWKVMGPFAKILHWAGLYGRDSHKPSALNVPQHSCPVARKNRMLSDPNDLLASVVRNPESTRHLPVPFVHEPRPGNEIPPTVVKEQRSSRRDLHSDLLGSALGSLGLLEDLAPPLGADRQAFERSAELDLLCKLLALFHTHLGLPSDFVRQHIVGAVVPRFEHPLYALQV